MRKVNFKTLNGNVFTIECDPDVSATTNDSLTRLL